MVGLNAEGASAFSTFSRQCAEKGLLQRRNGLTDEDSPDGITDERTLLRFLQANQLDPSKALEQFQQATKFHTENDALRLYDLMSVSDFEDTRLLYPHWTGRCDRYGRPILMLDVSALGKEALMHWRETRNMPLKTGSGFPSTMVQRALVYFDHFTRFVLPLCSAVHGASVTNCVYVVDASSLSMRQAWDVREFAQEISWILATCYPETIYRVYACNISGYCSRLWAILKPFVDPVTAAKIRFLQSSESYSFLKEEIDHANIPSTIGGGHQFDTGMRPDLDEEICQALGWTAPQTDLPPGPLKWTQTEEGKKKAVATGTVEGEPRREEIATLRNPSS
ncbi:CRAL-TRIO domain-containing protein [Aspergillus varians]